jgi:hypothetical protein
MEKIPAELNIINGDTITSATCKSLRVLGIDSNNTLLISTKVALISFKERCTTLDLAMDLGWRRMDLGQRRIYRNDNISNIILAN